MNNLISNKAFGIIKKLLPNYREQLTRQQIQGAAELAQKLIDNEHISDSFFSGNTWKLSGELGKKSAITSIEGDERLRQYLN